MVDPSARNRRDRQQERDSQRAATTGDGKDAGEQHQRKHARYNEISAFDFFAKGTKKKSNAIAISSWTIEKRRSPNTFDDFSIPFIDSRLFSLGLNPRKDEHALGLSGEIARARAGERDEFVQARVRFHRWFVCADLSAILPSLLGTLYRPLGQCHAPSRCAYLMDNLDPSLRVFSFSGAVGKVRKIGIIWRYR